VIAREAGAEMRALVAGAPGVRLEVGPFDPVLIERHVLVVAATSEPVVNQAVAEAARAAHRLCNVVDDGAASSFIVPGIVDRSPVLVAVSSGGKAPVLARLLRQRIESWLPVRTGALALWAARWRAAVARQFSDPGARRDLWERLLGGEAAARVLEGDEAGADALADALVAGSASPATTGRAWLVGAGPGDPGLITARGLRALEQADVVLHDRLIAPELLRSARREAEIVCVGKAGGGPSVSQEEINRLLVSRVRAGRRVCRLKGGDPFVFGRGAEEALALAEAGLPFEIVPGVTAASGCGAAAGIPLTHRGLASAVTLVTASAAAGGSGPDWAQLAAAGQTLVVYMGGARIADVAAELVRHGRPAQTPAAVICHGTTAEQEVTTGTLADIGERSRASRSLSPALLVVGETVALAPLLAGRTAGADSVVHGPRAPSSPPPVARAG
jgi:uroporphyrin-III C-methyltransferase/precorrin-2 dehydrogenase/sirohydrochlorin ferrochelatase